MNIYEQFKTNVKLETSGIDLDYGEGVVITIARAGGSNKNYQKSVERESRSIRRAIETKNVDNEKALSVLQKVYASSVVLGWKGVTDEEGKMISFTVENCIKLFKNLPDLFLDIMEQAGTRSLFLQSNLEQEAKNS